MLGDILGALSKAASAEEALMAVGDAALVARVRQSAAMKDMAVGAFVASTVRQVLDYAEESVWLDLLGRTADAARPGVAALEIILMRAFPAPAGQATKA